MAVAEEARDSSSLAMVAVAEEMRDSSSLEIVERAEKAWDSSSLAKVVEAEEKALDSSSLAMAAEAPKLPSQARAAEGKAEVGFPFLEEKVEKREEEPRLQPQLLLSEEASEDDLGVVIQTKKS